MNDDQLSISSFLVHGKTHEQNYPDQIRQTYSLVDNLKTAYIVPISIVENDSFKQLILDLDPKYVLLGRQF